MFRKIFLHIYSQIYKKQREQRLAAKKKVGGGRGKPRLEDAISDKSSEESPQDKSKSHQEIVVIEKLEKGEENLFNIIRSKRMNHQHHAMEPVPRKALHSLAINNEDHVKVNRSIKSLVITYIDKPIKEVHEYCK